MEPAARPSGDILRRNPQQDYELIQRVGSGTYGDVYKSKQLKSGTLPVVRRKQALWRMYTHVHKRNRGEIVTSYPSSTPGR